MKSILRTSASLALTLVVLGGCARQPSVIKIGAIAPVTGEAATFGTSVKKGVELAIEEWNAAGGILGQDIKMVFADDKGDPAEGATVFTKLIQQDKVALIIGAVMSKVTLAGAPIAQAAGIPVISPTSTAEKVTLVGDYIFRSCFIDPFQGTVGARFAYGDLGARRAGVIFDIGNDYTKGLAESFRSVFEGEGGQVLAFEGHPSGVTDFKAQLTKILASSPDVIYCPDYYNDDALIAKQARELGYSGPIVGGDGWESAELVKIGGDAVDNCFYTNHYASDSTDPAVVKFVSAFTAKYGAAPDAFAVLAYDAAYIAFEAIKKAGSTDPAAIKAALAATDLAAVCGRYTFDENRNPIKSAAIIEVRGGKLVYRTTVNP